MKIMIVERNKINEVIEKLEFIKGIKYESIEIETVGKIKLLGILIHNKNVEDILSYDGIKEYILEIIEL